MIKGDVVYNNRIWWTGTFEFMNSLKETLQYFLLVNSMDTQI